MNSGQGRASATLCSSLRVSSLPSKAVLVRGRSHSDEGSSRCPMAGARTENAFEVLSREEAAPEVENPASVVSEEDVKQGLGGEAALHEDVTPSLRGVAALVSQWVQAEQRRQSKLRRTCPCAPARRSTRRPPRGVEVSRCMSPTTWPASSFIQASPPAGPNLAETQGKVPIKTDISKAPGGVSYAEVRARGVGACPRCLGTHPALCRREGHTTAACWGAGRQGARRCGAGQGAGGCKGREGGHCRGSAGGSQQSSPQKLGTCQGLHASDEHASGQAVSAHPGVTCFCSWCRRSRQRQGRLPRRQTQPGRG